MNTNNTDYKRILIPAGTALVGTKNSLVRSDGESPLRKQKINDFYIDNTSVSNRRFAEFIDATSYKTEAEKIGWSFAFFNHLPIGDSNEGSSSANWWRKIHNANWRQINGLGSEKDWKPDHPVVHVSHKDAIAFAHWADGRLPTEAEWEHAARGGLGDVRFPWGDDEPDDDTFQPCNIWQGSFPHHNTCTDGYNATAPVKSFQPNGFGLYNLVGNVWEWTSTPYTVRALHSKARKKNATMKGCFVLKGGSFMCHKSYCFRYRIAARSGNTPDSTTSHQGFRLAYDQQ